MSYISKYPYPTPPNSYKNYQNNLNTTIYPASYSDNNTNEKGFNYYESYAKPTPPTKSLLDCPSASIKEQSPYLPYQPNNNITTWNEQPLLTNFSGVTINKCTPQFNNAINTCTPSTCYSPSDNKFYNCDKLFNNHTKRQFLTNRK